MYRGYYFNPFEREDELYYQNQKYNMPDLPIKEKRTKCDVAPFTDALKTFFEEHCKYRVNISKKGLDYGYLLISLPHFGYVIGHLLKDLEPLEVPHLNVEIGEYYTITITFNFELPIPRNMVDIAIAAEYSGFEMTMEDERLIFRARVCTHTTYSLYRPIYSTIKSDLYHSILRIWKRKQ